MNFCNLTVYFCVLFFRLQWNLKHDIFFEKGGIFMKKIEKALLTASKRMAISSLKRDANSTTCCAVYQPKAPASLDKFKKHID